MCCLQESEPSCGALLWLQQDSSQWLLVPCTETFHAAVVCQHEKIQRPPPLSPYLPNQSLCAAAGLFSCFDGSCLLDIYRCDGVEQCRWGEDEKDCMVVCTSGQEIHHSMAECTNCTAPDCQCEPLFHQCSTTGCIHASSLCDCTPQCADASDEHICNNTTCLSIDQGSAVPLKIELMSPTSCIYFRVPYTKAMDYGMTKRLWNCTLADCLNFFKCHFSYCIPCHYVCDGIADCPTGEDERQCQRKNCYNKLRCPQEDLCITATYVCDGVIDCTASADDEKICWEEACPAGCTCFSSAWVCNGLPKNISIHLARSVKKIHVDTSSNIDMNETLLQSVLFSNLIVLNIQNTSFSELPHLSSHLSELAFLDVSYGHFVKLHRHAFHSLIKLRSLNLAFTNIPLLVEYSFLNLSKLELLNLSYTPLAILQTNTFAGLSKLNILDITSCLMTQIEPYAFYHLIFLQTLHTNNYLVCCPLPQQSCEHQPQLNPCKLSLLSKQFT